MIFSKNSIEILELFHYLEAYYFLTNFSIKICINIIKTPIKIETNNIKITPIRIKITQNLNNHRTTPTIKITQINITFPDVIKETLMLKIYDIAYLYISDQYRHI